MVWAAAARIWRPATLFGNLNSPLAYLPSDGVRAWFPLVMQRVENSSIYSIDGGGR
jgi:hypothetical protein